jgi:acylphosphatase
MSESNAVRAISAVVAGRVHGVGFRYSTQRVAADLGLTGWVRNLPDGTVDVWAQGDPNAIERFCLFLEKGPPAARVTSANIRDVNTEPALAGFDVRF